MGRELMVDRIDFMKDGTIHIRNCPDYYICGRTDFTNAIARLFYNPNVESLIVNYEGTLNEKGTDKIHVFAEGWGEKEFDLEIGSIDFKTVEDICKEYIEKDNEEITRCNNMLEDAREARRHASSRESFEDLSTLVDDLTDHLNSYFQEAKTYLKYINQLNLCFDEKTTEKTYILLTLSE